MSTEVVCRDLAGALHRVTLADREEHGTPASRLRQRIVTGPGDVPLLCKSVPAEAGRREPGLYDLLDNEIRMIARLTRVLGDRAGEVPVLVGYNMDVEEPFVLLRPYVGQAAPIAVRFLDQARKRQFQIGLLRALHVVGSAGVVHNALDLDALRWNGTIAQLVDFEQARFEGEPRRPAAGPYLSPEQRQGTGVADHRDDVWSAGVLIRELVMGPQALTAPADQSDDPPRLQALLRGVFLPVEDRPVAAELLRRLHAPAPRVDGPAGTDGLDRGYRLFDEACLRKGAAANGNGSDPAPGRRGLRRRFLWGDS